MKKSVFTLIACTLAVVLVGCGSENTGEDVSSGENGSERIVEASIAEEDEVSDIQEDSSEESELDENTVNISKSEAIRVVWSHAFHWAMGSDYVYVDSNGRIYEEHEVENPDWMPWGACSATYTGQLLKEEELKELLSMDEDDEDSQKEMFRKKRIRFGE